ncbi:hypothetical protein [Parapedobacter lycopersici]|uniref:hypothetical protein n=1 Tax=Parapedobacter lycopersici TaxID=1864939 RepID=UPI00214D9FB8|nr:hypothetical protein [Parapedobacter lycopersici]
MKFSRFAILYISFSLAVALLALGLQHFMETVPVLSPHFWLLFAVIFLLTGLAYGLSDIGIRKGGQVSILSLMGGLFLKLLISLVVIAVLIIKFPENKLLTAINFFSLYFLFTLFEVICLLRNLRDQNQT